MPLGAESDFEGVVDLVTMQKYMWNAEGDLDLNAEELSGETAKQVEIWREKFLEGLSEADDTVMELYLEGNDVPVELANEALRKGTIQGRFHPVLFGSSLKKKGVQPLMDAIVSYLPSPVDLPPVRGECDGQIAERAPDPDEPFSALLFKIMAFAGRPTLHYVRVYSGSCSLGDRMLVARTGKTQRAMKIMRMHANRREEIREMAVGDIISLVGLRDIRTGDTLCHPESPINLEEPLFPEPVIFTAIEPRSLKDQEKLLTVLDLLAEEDPTFGVRVDEETGQVILSGMGELHLEVLANRLFSDFKVEGRVGNPQVSYRETVTKVVTRTEKFSREIAGQLQEAEVTLKVEPLAMAGIVQYEDEAGDVTIPTELREVIREAAMRAAGSGAKAGYPVIDVRITLVDAHYHPDRSTETAFTAAVSTALTQCLRDADPVLLEPVMAVQVETPEEHTGDVMGSLTLRRGTIEGVEKQGNMEIISASIPLKEMFGYTTALRSLTQGRGSFTMELAHYRPVEG